MSSDQANGRLSRIWSALSGRPRAQEQNDAAYRRLALQLHYDLPRGETRSALLLTPSVSQLAGLGALQLAWNLVKELGRSVLLIDICRPGQDITALLGASGKPGWADLVRGEEPTLDRVVLPTSSEHLYFLPAGNDTAGSQSPAAAEAHMEAAYRQYDFVLISGGSVLDDGSGLGLLPHVGCVLLLLAEHETRLDDLRSAQHALTMCKARNVRIVLATPSRERPTAGVSVRTENVVQPQAMGKLVVE